MSYLGWTPWSSLEVIMPPVSIMRNQINHEEDDVNRTECRRKPKEDIIRIMTVACILRTRWRSFSVWRVSYPGELGPCHARCDATSRDVTSWRYNVTRSPAILYNARKYTIQQNTTFIRVQKLSKKQTPHSRKWLRY